MRWSDANICAWFMAHDCALRLWSAHINDTDIARGQTDDTRVRLKRITRRNKQLQLRLKIAIKENADDNEE